MAHFAHQFLFFLLSHSVFLPLSPTMMTGLRLFLPLVLGLLYHGTHKSPCLLVNNTEERQVLGWGNMASVQHSDKNGYSNTAQNQDISTIKG